MKIPGLFTICLCVAASRPVLAQAPTVSSVFPAGGQRGTLVTAHIRGENLKGAHAVWLKCDCVQTVVTSVEEINLEGEKNYGGVDTSERPGHSVGLTLTISDTAALGFHLFRLVTTQGLSNPLLFHVHAERSIAELDRSKAFPETAQPIEFPAVIHGRVGRPGELDYFGFDVQRSQSLRFEVLTGSGLVGGVPGTNLQPDLAILDPSGSWFDSRRPTRIEVEDDSNFFRAKELIFLPRLSHRFEKKQRYLASVGTLGGNGSADHTYLLRIIPATAEAVWSPATLAHADEFWNEHDFGRTLQPDRLRQLATRTVCFETGGLETVPEQVTVIEENEPNDIPADAREIASPIIVEGTIDTPGDVDSFTFHVHDRQKLVFEIETPTIAPPHFSPRLTVLDLEGNRVFDNIHRFTGGDGDDWVKTLQPKVVYSFDNAGKYCLQLRDLTSRRADPGMKYRVFIRSEFPHLGAVAARRGRNENLDLINLCSGESMKLNVVTELEESYSGEIALNLENLPPGVQVLPASSTTDEKFLARRIPRRGDEKPEQFFPERTVTTLMLIADVDAAPISGPRELNLQVRAVIGGTPGRAFVSQTIPFMLTRGSRPESAKE